MLIREKKNAFLILLFLLLANIFAWRELYFLNKNSCLRVVFFDVGQGDSIFIESPYGHQILIDGGPDSSLIKKLSREIPFWDHNIDMVILTHPEKDHITGLIDVLKKYKVDNILWTGVYKNTDIFHQWEEALKEEEKEGAKVYIARTGEKILFLNSKGNPFPFISIEIFNPFENLYGRQVKNTNDTSIVTRLCFLKNCFFFTGDISKNIERALIKNN